MYWLATCQYSAFIFRIAPNLLRELLASELTGFAQSEDDEKILEKLRKGVFFIPSETTKRIFEMIYGVTEDEKRNALLKLFGDIVQV